MATISATATRASIITVFLSPCVATGTAAGGTELSVVGCWSAGVAVNTGAGGSDEGVVAVSGVAGVCADGAAAPESFGVVSVGSVNRSSEAGVWGSTLDGDSGVIVVSFVSDGASEGVSLSLVDGVVFFCGSILHFQFMLITYLDYT